MINIEATGSIIHLFGRDEDGKRYHTVDQKFKPYFYAEDEMGEYDTIDETKARKYFVSLPQQVRDERARFEKTFEADITYVNRYMIDKVEKIDKEPIRKCYFDIENKDSLDVENTPEPITVVGCYDSFGKKKHQFIWHRSIREKKTEKSETRNIYWCKDEKEMLNDFIRFTKFLDPDIMIAWNGDRFDYLYLINRCMKVGVDLSQASPLRNVHISFNPRIVGMTLFDLMKGYKHLTHGGKESYSLDFTGQQELGMEKIEFEGTHGEFWAKEPRKFVEVYNDRDLEIMIKLDEKLGIIDYFDTMRRLAKCTFNDVFSNSRVVDMYVLDHCRKEKLLLPTRTMHKHEKFGGGKVFEPVKGLHKNVCVGDLKSMYPCAIISCNMSYETVGGEIWLGNGVSFTKKKKGIFPVILERLLEERMRWKSKLKDLEYGTEEYNRVYLQQYALKELLNSFYGALGFPNFRLYKPEVAASVTWFGRQTLQWTKKKLEEMGCQVVYGDTDSVFFIQNDTIGLDQTIKNGGELIAKVNKSYDEFAKQYRLEGHKLELEFEKVYKTLFFLEKTKKRYAGLKVWEGKPVDEIEIKGFDSQRSDTPRVSRKMLKKLYVMVLEEAGKEEVFEYIRAFTKKIKDGEFTPEQLALPVGLSKNPFNYEKPKVYSRGACFAIKNHGANIKAGDRIKYLYVSKSPKGIPRTDVIAFKDKLYPGYEIDVEQMTRRVVDMKVGKILENLGWSIEQMKGQKTLEGF